MATKTEAITLRVGPSLKAELEAAAAEEEMTLGEFVRYVLADYLRHRSADYYDRVRTDAGARAAAHHPAG